MPNTNTRKQLRHRLEEAKYYERDFYAQYETATKLATTARSQLNAAVHEATIAERNWMDQAAQVDAILAELSQPPDRSIKFAK